MKATHEREAYDQTWESDPDLVRECARRFTPHQRFDLDPCASLTSAKATRFYTAQEDGLLQSWLPGELDACRTLLLPHATPLRLSVYINPPFAEVEHWVARAFHWLDTHPSAFQVMVFCTPSRTDRPWYHRLKRRCYMPDIEGRVSYGDLKGSPPWATTIAVAWPPFTY